MNAVGERWAVYVIAEKGSAVCKIGVAREPMYRLAAMQTGNCRPLDLAYQFWIRGRKTAYRLERRVHQSLEIHHLMGEWFYLPVEEAVTAIMEASVRPEFNEAQ